MKVLMISTDRKIFEENSAVRQRILEYGNLFGELHIIIFSGLRRNSGADFLSAEGGQKIRSRIARKDERSDVFAQRHKDERSDVFVQRHKGGGVEIQNSNIILYSTNSLNRWFYVFDAIRIGRCVIKNLKLKIENSNNNDEIFITCQDPFETGLVGWFIARKFKTKLQLQIHTDFLSKYFAKESLLNWIRVIIAKFLLSKADGIRVVSERIKKSLKTKNSLNILFKTTKKLKAEPKVLPIFIDLEKIKNTQALDSCQKYPQFDFIFLVASRLEKEKNVDLIIETFSKVVKKYPKAGLIIIGEGSLKKKLEEQVVRFGLQNSVVFKGWQNDLIEYYKSFDLFVSASSYEGFGITLIEAGMSGCPVLTTKVGVVGEILNEENSLICEVNDKNCLVDKMIYAINNKEILKDMNKKIQQQIQKKLITDKQEYLKEYRKTFEII